MTGLPPSFLIVPGERVDVLLLGVAEIARDLHRLRAQLELLRAAVEVRLEVLEREREVEDVEVAHVALRERVAQERGDHAGAVDGAGGEHALDQERLAADAFDADGGELGCWIGAMAVWFMVVVS